MEWDYEGLYDRRYYYRCSECKFLDEFRGETDPNFERMICPFCRSKPEDDE